MPFDNPPDGRLGDVQLLWAARNRIGHESGWVQSHYSDGDRLCLVAVLSVVAGSTSFDAPNLTERRLARLLADQLPDSVPAWARLSALPHVSASCGSTIARARSIKMCSLSWTERLTGRRTGHQFGFRPDRHYQFWLPVTSPLVGYSTALWPTARRRQRTRRKHFR